MSEMRLAVAGAAGRMGRMLIQAIHATPGATLAAALEAPGSITLGQDAGLLAGVGATGARIADDIDAALAHIDALIDFTTPAASVAFARAAARAGVAHVIGSTGFSAQDGAAIAEAASRIVIVRSGNFSAGVILLAGLARRAAATLGVDFDIEIVETHHRHKVDAPSGTALLLGEAAAAGRGVRLGDVAARGRDGHTGPRREGDIGFASLRGGSVVGDHTVLFAGPRERITLSHHAEDRSIFAAGAVRAALWTRGRAPGLYGMDDVLGLSDD